MMNESDYSSKVRKSFVRSVVALAWPDFTSRGAKATLSKAPTPYNNGATSSTRQLCVLQNKSGDEVLNVSGRRYDEDYRHWSPTSQFYAPADVLLQYLRESWQIHKRVLVEVSCCISHQCVEIYNFILTKDDERVTMPVIANPVVLRLTQEFGLILIRVYTASDDNHRMIGASHPHEECVESSMRR